jgi:hypothetical protein
MLDVTDQYTIELALTILEIHTIPQNWVTVHTQQDRIGKDRLGLAIRQLLEIQVGRMVQIKMVIIGIAILELLVTGLYITVLIQRANTILKLVTIITLVNVFVIKVN